MSASHTTLANWYRHLAEQLEAGIPLPDALQAAPGPSLTARKQLFEPLLAGETVARVIATAPPYLPHADRMFIIAAADSGRLPETFFNLHRRHERIAGIQRRVLFSTLYPLGVYHLAAAMLVLMKHLDYEAGLSSLNPSLMGLQALALILPLWALIGVLMLMARIESPLLPRLVRCLPLLRSYSRAQAVADLADSLGNFVETGLPIQRAWHYATEITHAAEFKRAYRSLQSTFEAGEDPAQELPKLKDFPADFCAAYQTGAVSGKLDQSLYATAKLYQAKANRALSLAAMTYPSILLALVTCMIAYTIIHFYAGYLSLLQNFGQ